MTGRSCELRTEGPEETRAMAGALARLCRPGDVVLLTGDLGAGKTVFAQGFGAALGVAEPVVSPTFTLVRQYPLPTGSDLPLRQFVHADLYRLSHGLEVADLGLGQLVEDAGVAVIEWGEAAAPLLGEDVLVVDLEADPADDRCRRIRLTAGGGTWPERWPALETTLGLRRGAA